MNKEKYIYKGVKNMNEWKNQNIYKPIGKQMHTYKHTFIHTMITI